MRLYFLFFSISHPACIDHVELSMRNIQHSLTRRVSDFVFILSYLSSPLCLQYDLYSGSEPGGVGGCLERGARERAGRGALRDQRFTQPAKTVHERVPPGCV